MTNQTATIERWGLFEVSLTGPDDGNPFLDVTLSATFRFQQRAVTAPGFYDGDGVYMVRFMPDTPGEWSYITHSNRPNLDGITGQFVCTPPSPRNHGPVRVRDAYHFAYEDGTPYIPVGSTCYVWNHQGDEMEATTLRTLKDSPFNKLRFCVFPKDYSFNKNEPPHHPFEGSAPENWDFTRFNPVFFQHLEQCMGNLLELGIEGDLILFHPYDRWGYSKMSAEVDDRYLRYVVARLWAYRNVWWSMANEFDFMPAKNLLDWDRFFRIVQESDPAQHLRSVHNGTRFYDHAKPWVTHCSVQSQDLFQMTQWRAQYRKPVVVDECAYEGNIEHLWGNITAQELVNRFWIGFSRGGYVGHGETYLHPDDILWWSKGGVLHGESPARIAFLRKIWEETPLVGAEPLQLDWNNPGRVGSKNEVFLHYFGIYAPGRWKLTLPENAAYRIELIDTWEMTIEPVEGLYRNGDYVTLVSKPYQAIRITKSA
jgi:hypothetical protein